MVLVGRYRAVMMMMMMVSRQLLGFCPPGGFIIANFWQGNMHDFQIPLHLLCSKVAEGNKQAALMGREAPPHFVQLFLGYLWERLTGKIH